MKTYELTYIASPTANQEELEALKEEIGKLIQSKEGAVLKLEGSTGTFLRTKTFSPFTYLTSTSLESSPSPQYGFSSILKLDLGCLDIRSIL